MPGFKKKLGSDTSYKRPKKTYQEQLTPEEIQKKLESYKKVDDIADVPLNTHLRYFTKVKGEYLFRTGGFLHRKSEADKYVVLSNGTSTWTVQTPDTIFYQKLSHAEEIAAIHELYQKQLAEKDARIKRLRDYIKKHIKD